MATQIQTAHLLHGGKPTKQGHSSVLQNTVQFLFRTLGSIHPEAAGAIAAKLWFSPRRILPTRMEQDVLEHAEEKIYRTVNGKRVVIYAWGYGPTVLLLHGWGGRAGQMTRFVQPLLDKGYSVVCFDAPAHGNSDGSETNISEIVEIMEFIAKREQGLHAVIAYSFGALASALAVKRGLKLQQSVFIAPAVSLQFITQLFKKGIGMTDSSLPFFKKAVESKFPELGKEFWQDLDLDRSARTFTFPGLLICDSKDPHNPMNQLIRVAESWPDSQIHYTQGTGHHKILKTAEVIQLAVGFLKYPAGLKQPA